MPDTMVRVVMVLLTELLFSYVVYEYFCIFLKEKRSREYLYVFT